MSKPAVDNTWTSICIGTWVALLGLTFLAPFLRDSSTLGEDLTRNTVRLALLYWCASCALQLLAYATGLARWFWTLGWLAFLIHLAMAFHFYHHWSHAEAVAHTEEVSGFGWGILFSHLFTLLWSAEVIAWWLAPTWRATRPPWFDGALHGYMVFIVFNGTVVYEEGFIRWAGVAMFTLLGGLCVLRIVRKRR